MKKKLLVSFSGGRTSALMCKYLLENKKDEFDMIFVFANTGKEREETLDFVNKCDNEFKLNLIWVEAIEDKNFKITSNFKIVNYKTASRNGEPFELLFSKMGLVNQNRSKCTEFLKITPIHKYIKSIGWKKYYTAIGIRTDEHKRINRELAI